MYSTHPQRAARLTARLLMLAAGLGLLVPPPARAQEESPGGNLFVLTANGGKLKRVAGSDGFELSLRRPAPT